MTVKELIEMLKLFPQDYPVFHGTSRKYEPVNIVTAKTIKAVVLMTEEDADSKAVEYKPKRDFKDWYLEEDKFKVLNYEGRSYERNKD